MKPNQCSLLFFFRRCAFKWFLLGDYWSRAPSRAVSVPPSPPPLRAFSVPPRDFRASSVPRFDPLSPLDLLSEYEREPFQRGLSPTPVKAHRWAPRCSEVAFDTDGNLIFALLSSIQFFVWPIFFVFYWKSTFTQQNRIHESNIKEGFFLHFCFLHQFDFVWRIFEYFSFHLFADSSAYSIIVLSLLNSRFHLTFRIANLPWRMAASQQLGQPFESTRFFTTIGRYTWSILVWFGTSSVRGNIQFATILARIILVTS